MQSPVNASGKRTVTRGYDARRRRQLAAESLHSVRTHARELFLTQGFGATTIAEIARAAGVSAESVYKNFGSKAGLVRAIYEESLLGAGGPPAEQRSDLAQMTETDPVVLMEQFGRFTTEISPIGAPIYLLIRDASASGDASMAALLRDVDEARYRRMLHNARQLVGRGLLRPGLGTAEAADVMFTSTTAELYETLVIKRGWSAERYGTFIARTLSANLL
ncbi:TetR/AcrR family transcriptional regulator [Arthrobacter sp. SLBN-122]|uniref:TetR/AcrR family transcriptional regulator n=1 Tax=Arthrobacter sp. SLBN-122 TaxID=2768455 RepID=UPI0011519DC4|nr:TetR/AcrR family transcriptional regulator [Arthrobacter sp. SLBN-122]TQJ33408.1 TetR family transcriptional regulator [Arthrobacter sp. SLBN-122]